MPEDRKEKPKGLVKERVVKIVKVPCDEKEPIVEVDIPVEDGGQEISCLPFLEYTSTRAK